MFVYKITTSRHFAIKIDTPSKVTSVDVRENNNTDKTQQLYFPFFHIDTRRAKSREVVHHIRVGPFSPSPESVEISCVNQQFVWLFINYHGHSIAFGSNLQQDLHTYKMDIYLYTKTCSVILIIKCTILLSYLYID